MSMDLGLDPGDMDNVEKVQDFIRLVNFILVFKYWKFLSQIGVYAGS